MNRHLEKSSGMETPFHRLCRRAGEISLAGRNFYNAKRGLISWKRNVNIQSMSRGPGYQFFRSVAPAEPERRFEDRLGVDCRGAEPEAEDRKSKPSDRREHGRRLRFFRLSRKPGRLAGGSVLVEAALAMTMLSVLGLTMLKLSLNITAPRQWTLQQSITDAYLTFEKASAQRQSFETITSSQSLWPAYPNVATTNVVFGKLPGGKEISGTVSRTRTADPNNLPAKGGTGTTVTNPTSMEVWKLQSVVRYKVGARTYLKSRTVVRSQ